METMRSIPAGVLLFFELLLPHAYETFQPLPCLVYNSTEHRSHTEIEDDRFVTGTQSLLPLKVIIGFGCLVAAVALALIWDFQSTGTPEPEPAAALREDSRGVENISEESRGEMPDSVNPLPHPGSEGEREALRSSIVTASIRGMVVDPDRQPVVGAKIAVEPAHLEYIQAMLPLGDFHAGLASDSSGRFAVSVPQAGAFSLQIEKKGPGRHAYPIS